MTFGKQFDRVCFVQRGWCDPCGTPAAEGDLSDWGEVEREAN